MIVHLVDGTYELFRAYYGAPESRAPDGREVGATRGLARSLLALIRNEPATHLAVAFDHVVESFRNQLFEGYKTGEAVAPELLGQFELAEEMARALGLVVWPMVEFEADDALATAAARLVRERRVAQVRICSPDKDLAQCVVGTRVVCVDRRRGMVIDEMAVRERFGVAPSSVPDWLALVGDSADGIPGVPRWGARSTSAMLGEYGRIERIPADAARWKIRPRGAEALAASLREYRSEAELYRRLAILRTDVPLSEQLDDLEWRGARLPQLEGLCRRIGDEGLVERVVAGTGRARARRGEA